MKLKKLLTPCTNCFDKIFIYDQNGNRLIFNGKQKELEDYLLDLKIKTWQVSNRQLFIEIKDTVKPETEAEVKEEVKSKVDNDTLICFLRQHLDLDEDKTVINYVNIEGRTVEIKLSDLKWKYEEFFLLFDVKIKYRINRQGFLVLYLEDLRKG